MDPKNLIKKANLTFASKFIWFFVCHRESPITTDNILTWDRAFLVEAMVAGFEIDFMKLLIYIIHDRAFKDFNSCPFACMIFQLCRNVGVPIWHIDVFHNRNGIVDIGLIRDEANMAAQRRGPRVYLQPLSENLR